MERVMGFYPTAFCSERRFRRLPVYLTLPGSGVIRALVPPDDATAILRCRRSMQSVELPPGAQCPIEPL